MALQWSALSPHSKKLRCLTVTHAFPCARVGFSSHFLLTVQKHAHQVDWRQQIVPRCGWVSAVRLVMDSCPVQGEVDWSAVVFTVWQNYCPGFLTAVNVDQKRCRFPCSASAVTSGSRSVQLLCLLASSLFIQKSLPPPQICSLLWSTIPKTNKHKTHLLKPCLRVCICFRVCPSRSAHSRKSNSYRQLLSVRKAVKPAGCTSRATNN